MRPLKTTLFALAFILLGTYVYFFEIQNGSREKSQRLLNFKESEVESLILSYPDQEIRFERDASGKWRMVQPLETPADPSIIQSVLSALATSEIKRTIEEKPTAEALRDFGLEKPAVKVLVTLRNGATLPPVAVGMKSPVGTSAYVRRGGESRVLLSNASLRSSLEKKLKDFRDRRMIELTDGIQQLNVKGSHGELLLTKKDEGWFIEKPGPYKADQTLVGEMLTVIRSLSAQDFIEDAPSELAKYGLAEPRLRITIGTGKKEGKREILFGNRREGKDGVYALLDTKETVYAVHESVLGQLDKSLTALRDKEVLSFPREQVAQVEVQTQGESWTLRREEKGRWLAAPDKRRVKETVVRDYLSALSSLRAKEFPDDEPRDLKRYGLEPPALKIALKASDGKNLATILGGKSGGAYYAKREGHPTVFAIEEFAFRQINKPLSDFLEEDKNTSAKR